MKMKPIDQAKVIVLSFLSVVVIAGFMTYVSLETTKAVKSHHAEEAHTDSHTETDAHESGH